MLRKKRDALGEDWPSNRKIIEIASACMHLNDDENRQQGMLRKVTAQQNYESSRNEEEDECGFQS